MNTAKPTKSQLIWHEQELGVLIHYCFEIYHPELPGTWYKTSLVREKLDPKTIHPTKLEPEQWVRSAAELGAKYAVLVAKHTTGFALWDTKVNDFSIAHTDWRGGGGDVCREFIDACNKYGLKPGFYYSLVTNGYYDINDEEKQDYRSEKYQKYLECVKAQLEELWGNYGDLFEIWFDGGVIPTCDGGIDVTSLLKKYQPDAVCFQGPADFEHDLRWVGNEDGLAPENCWGATGAGEHRFDGTVADDTVGSGNPDGLRYCPAECDVPNRNHLAFGGGWGWRAGEEKYRFTPGELFNCYLKSVGRNTNMLLGMCISTEGDFQDEEQLIEFGKLIKKSFCDPITVCDSPSPVNNKIILNTNGKTVDYIVIREDITEGQLIRGFRILADDKCIYESCSVGHKRIIPLGGLKAGTIAFEITQLSSTPKLRDITLY